jgi:hypothetical protein
VGLSEAATKEASGGRKHEGREELKAVEIGEAREGAQTARPPTPVQTMIAGLMADAEAVSESPSERGADR